MKQIIKFISKTHFIFILSLLCLTSYSQKTHIEENGEAIRLDGSSPYLSWYDGANFKGFLQHNNSNNMLLYNTQNGFMQFATNYTPRMTIANTGNIGINTINPSTALHVNGEATVSDTLHIKKNTKTPWGHEWIADMAEDKIWMKQSWSSSTGDKLYLSSSGGRNNNLQGGILMSENRISFGKGHDNGLQLNEEHLRLTTAGDLFLGGFNADNANPKMRIKRRQHDSSGLLIENATGNADTWLSYTDGNNYITADRSTNFQTGGRTYIRHYNNNGTYVNTAEFYPSSTQFNTEVYAPELIVSHSDGYSQGLTITNNANFWERWVIGQTNTENSFDEEDSALKFWFNDGNGGSWIPRLLEEDGDWITASDRNLKKNIKKISDGQLAKINSLKPSQYNYKSQRNNEIQYGFIAQELQEIYPLLVTTMIEGNLGVNYEELIPILTKGIQEQQEIISELQEKNKALESKFIKLEELVNSLIENK